MKNITMNKIKIFAALVVAMFASASLYAQDVNAVKAKYNEAAAQISAKDFNAAIALLNEAVDMGLETEGAEETVDAAQKLLPVCYFQSGLRKVKLYHWHFCHFFIFMIFPSFFLFFTIVS